MRFAAVARDGFQPTLPARGATPTASWFRGLDLISTHAPRTGSDGIYTHDDGTIVVISTHAPRTGSDLNPVDSHKSFYDFNPRSPHGERQLTFLA